MTIDTPQFPEFKADNYKAVVDYIKAHPSEYNQSSWHSPCGTTACFAGRAQIMAGRDPNRDTAWRDARVFLGLTQYEAAYLFNVSQKIEVIEACAPNKNGYSRDGYSRDGYDSDGYDSDGYSRAGYSRDGYDSDGYSRDGYDRAGYDSDGLNAFNQSKENT